MFEFVGSWGKYTSYHSLIGVFEIIDIPNTSQHNISTIKLSSDHTVRGFKMLWKRPISMFELCRPRIDADSFSEGMNESINFHMFHFPEE